MFTRARIKLTAWYLVIIIVISISFSLVIHRVLSSELERFANMERLRIERRLHQNYIFSPDNGSDFPQPPFIEPELIEETKNRLGIMLVLVNAGILLFAGGFGYFLAGRTLKPIKNMVDEQNQFISDASHELRTPLTSLKSAFEVYLRNSHPDVSESKTLVTESIIEVNKLQNLSESLLQLSQFQIPNGNVKFSSVLVSDIINDARRKMEPLAKQKSIRITTDSKKIRIWGNKYSLTDLLVILLDNAIKYSPKKSIVTINSRQINNSVNVTVVDKGIGINQNDLPHIFDRFYRADKSRSKAVAGYGLGLSIAKKIADLHHADIKVESQPNKGTKFTVIFQNNLFKIKS